MSDEQVQWDALKALLAGTFLGDDVYDYGKVPGENGNEGTLPQTYALLTIERRFVPTNRSGGTTRTGWRASVRFVGDNTYNARQVCRWVREAFETTPGRGKRITVDGVTSTPITHETTDAVGPDDGRYSGLSQWTYAL